MSNGLGKRTAAARRRAALAAAVVLSVGVAGCVGTQGLSTKSQHGYVVSDMAIEQVPVGSSKDQVLIALGSPSTTGNFGGEAYYYISQTRRQSVAFMPEKVVDQRVLAVYFNDRDEVVRIADYGLKDGKVFDFVSRTTPTGGADAGFLKTVLGGILGRGGR